MITFLVLLIGFLSIGLLYLFLVCPALKKNKNTEKLKGLYIAHRGLHDKEIPENSIPAFLAAVSGGYAIEIDIHITKDNSVVVFHDNTIKRMCGQDKKIEDMTLEEIKGLRLLDTDCTIPTLEECLNAVKGRVPLLIEFKAGSIEVSKRLCVAANEILKKYEGIYFIQSFFPFVLSWYRKNRPDVCRGQLSTPFKEKPIAQRILGRLLTNFIARPHFISYEHKYHKKCVLRLNKALGALIICWTLKDEKELEKAKESFSAYIFEDFIP